MPLGPLSMSGVSLARTVSFSAATATIVLPLFAPQPLVGIIASSFSLSSWAIGAAATVTLLGYATGLFLLTPLTDLLETRRVILATVAADVVALAAAAAAPSALAFFVSAFVVGITTSSIQMLVPAAAMLAPEPQRGRVIGNVVSGLMIGILLSRPIASLTAGAWGWRGSYALDAVAMAMTAAFLCRVLPRHTPTRHAGYLSLIASFGTLVKEEAIFRRRAVYQALCMCAFNAFWTAVALRLDESPFGLAAAGVALFALVGVAGAIAAPIAGRLGDRELTAPATRVAHAAISVALIVAGTAGAGWFGFDPNGSPRFALALLVAAAVLLDLGVVADQTLGRRAINLIRPEARGRLNGFYTGFFFLGGSMGSALGGVAWPCGGWSGVCSVGLGFGAAALILSITEMKGARRVAYGRSGSSRGCRNVQRSTSGGCQVSSGRRTPTGIHLNRRS